MNTKYGLVAVIMTVLVGVILIGTLLAPTIQGIQKTVGDEVTKENTGSVYYSECESGVDVSFTSTSTGSLRTNTLNEETITTELTTETVIMTNQFAVLINNSGHCNYYGHINKFFSTGSTDSLTVTITGMSAKVEITGQTAWTIPLAWGYFMDEEGEVQTLMEGDSAYVNSIKDLTMGGYYATGDNDTRYYYHDGETYASVYSMTVTGDLTLVDGTTDIYTVTNISVDIGGEDFVPYNILVPRTVTGHESGGAEYTLYGVVVVLFIVVLFVVAVRSLITRERD